MNRRAFISGITVSLLTVPFAAETQQAGKLYRVGWLGLASPGPEVLRIVDGLRPDPLSTGLVASLGRTGGNITGVTLIPGPEIVGKYLHLIKETVLKVSRVAVLWNQGSQLAPLMVREAEVAARALQLQVQSVGVRDADEFEGAFAAMTKERASAVVVLADPVSFLHRKQLAELAARSRLPAMYALTEHVGAGGLMAYSANFAEAARRAAIYVDKILKGAKPGDLPIEQPTKFDLTINLKTAKGLGLTIPRSLLLQADQVIER